MPGRFPLGALALLVLTGCFSYRTLPPGSVPAGSEVRVRVTAAGADRIRATEREPYSLEASLEGTLLGRSGDGLRLRLSESRGSPASPPVQHDVSLLPGEVLALEVRRLDAVRTGILAAVAGTAAAVWLASRFDSAGGSGAGPGTGGPDNASFPALRLSVPVP